MRRVQIAVIGYNKDRCTDAARKAAYEAGAEIAWAGAALVCGGLGGVMEEACRGAKDNGGPGVRHEYHDAYYAAFVLSPEGHNIEAVCFQDEA